MTTVALAGALLGGSFATPAAAADPNTCPKGKVCGWTGKNRTGTRTSRRSRPAVTPSRPPSPFRIRRSIE
ncbi:peptidase inhibitor family I36 protein [Streptomyces althioticus]|uniref:peptidase inhibitor family I36 protein n=1 Tax=Streptomyces althioticus TaxID=83380 RepID=UPI0033E8B4B4